MHVLEATSSAPSSDSATSVAEAEGGESENGEQETVIDGYEDVSDPCLAMHTTLLDSIDVSTCD